MTAKELIEVLSKLPPDSTVVTFDEIYEWIDVDSVEQYGNCIRIMSRTDPTS